MTNDLAQQITTHLNFIYGDTLARSNYQTASALTREIIEIMRIDNERAAPIAHRNHWSEKDVLMISYGDSIIDHATEACLPPLKLLHAFMSERTDGTINSLHILPFYPYTSDDGFSISDYQSVRPGLGDWSDVESIAREFRLMSDLVINHCSANHPWFQQFIDDQAPGKNYFFTASPTDTLRDVVRPRTNNLLRETITTGGIRYVWCTFSHDQVDLDFSNPQVLVEFTKIVRFYLDREIKIFRLDAVAFLWKEIGTSCLNLPQTHEIVQLIRLLVEYAVDDAVIITETNIPNTENLAYFGNANEAHCVYNFSLPPLLLYTLISGNCHYLKLWMMRMPPAQNGTTYLNFIASHDGIGLRPTEGLLENEEVDHLIALMENFGGRVSYRALDDGNSKPYEINISLFDALQGTFNGLDKFHIDRFICAHAIMLALEGIPAFYIHSLVATTNDHEKFARTGENRSLNRHQWDVSELYRHLDNPSSHHSQVFSQLKSLISIRSQQSAFHPNATQFTLHLGDELFGFWRQSSDRKQSIFCISNISDQAQELYLYKVNLTVNEEWWDLISETKINNPNEHMMLAPYQTIWLTNTALRKVS